MKVGFGKSVLRGLVFPLLAAGIAAICIIGVGEALLSVADHDFEHEYARKELWLGVALTVGVLAVAAFLASRPEGALGPLDERVAVGKKSMFAPAVSVPRPDPMLRHGAPGAISDLEPGYTLYARNGALAVVTDVFKSVEDLDERQRTLIYAKGMHGAPGELWIPVEAVTAVYPKTRTAFLAIQGDEMEAFGWHKAPASFSRGEREKVTPLY